MNGLYVYDFMYTTWLFTNEIIYTQTCGAFKIKKGLGRSYSRKPSRKFLLAFSQTSDRKIWMSTWSRIAFLCHTLAIPYFYLHWEFCRWKGKLIRNFKKMSYSKYILISQLMLIIQDIIFCHEPEYSSYQLWHTYLSAVIKIILTLRKQNVPMSSSLCDWASFHGVLQIRISWLSLMWTRHRHHELPIWKLDRLKNLVCD